MKTFIKCFVNYCILLFLFLLNGLHIEAQGIVGGLDKGETGLIFHETFSNATIAPTASAINTDWTYTFTAGTPGAPQIITNVPGSTSLGANEGYDQEVTKKALEVRRNAATNDIYIWTPVVTIPNSTRAWARFILHFQNTATSFFIGAAFDESPNDFNLVSETAAGIGPFAFTYQTTTYGETNMTNTGTLYRIVYVDISRYANRTGRLGFRLYGAYSGTTPNMYIDAVSIGKRPTNDDCNGAYQLVNGVNGPFYNTLATGLLPNCTSPSNTHMGGISLYLNPTSQTTRPGDGYEPATGGGVFSNTSHTVENSTWYKFTTPTLTTMTGCNGGSAPTSMQVRLTIENLSCEAPQVLKNCFTAGCQNIQQVRIFRSAFTCSSTNSAATEQLISYKVWDTTSAGAKNVNLSTVAGGDALIAYGTTYFFVVDGQLANDCRYDIRQSIFFNGSATSTPCGETPLPIELQEFYGEQVSENQVLLSWNTLSEKNADYFTIEKSFDGHRYEVIGRMKCVGNSSEKNNYSFEDKYAITGINYYRLKQTDFDGKFEYFDPVAVEVISSNLTCTLIPNPTSTDCKVQLSSRLRQKIQLEVFDLHGKSLYSNELRITEGINTLDIPSSAWNNGTYIVRVMGENEVVTQKLIVNSAR
jgi:hypothetical protein